MALSNPILILLILVTARCAVAQPSPSSLTGDDKDLYGQNFNAATAILIVVIVSAFFFLAFFSVYFRRCSRDRSAVVPAAGAAAASRRGGRRGLDPAVVETFPTLPYSAVTGLKIGKETLECAVCLSEFSDDETLRMLPRCCHVFHPECIDTWLASHVTCPVCRDNLSVAPADLEAGPEIPEPEETGGAGNSINNGVDVAADSGVNRKMGRSHTVGHVSEGVDRFTLRLPEHVRREIVAAGSLRRSASVAVFGGGGGEGSTRRGYRGRSGMWAGLSDRWASGILARVSTWRRGEGEGSVRRGEVAEGSMRGGMFDCLGGGGGGGDRGESSSSAVDDEEAPMKVFSRS